MRNADVTEMIRMAVCEAGFKPDDVVCHGDPDAEYDGDYDGASIRDSAAPELRRALYRAILLVEKSIGFDMPTPLCEDCYALTPDLPFGPFEPCPHVEVSA